jgi:hypothetical protein
MSKDLEAMTTDLARRLVKLVESQDPHERAELVAETVRLMISQAIHDNNCVTSAKGKKESHSGG